MALVAAFAFSAVAVASASALVWALNGVPVTETMATTSQATLELEDSKALIKTKVKCTGTDEGTVGTEGKDTITKVTVTSCVSVEGGCASAITAAAVHLPWNTKLITVENSKKEKEVRDEIKNSGAGTPGWEVKCTNIIGGKETDVCEGETTVGIDNVVKGTHKGMVASLFDATSREKPAKCSKGGEKSGFVFGTDFILGGAGVALTATEAKEVEL